MLSCDKYAQPIELGENWLVAYVMVKQLGSQQSETVVINCQVR